MSTVTEAVLKRIRALIAMSHSANENEAGNAASLVQDQLAKYNLEMADVLAHGGSAEFIEDALWAEPNKPWRRALQAAVCRLYFCDSYWGHDKKPTTRRKTGYIRLDGFIFVGAVHNVAVAKEMFVYLCDTIDRLAIETERARKKRFAKSSFLRDFREGCAKRLIERVNERWEEATRNPEAALLEGNKLPALYKQTNAALDDYMAAKHKDLQEVNRKDVTRSQEGRLAGYQKGGTVGLDTQIEKEKPRAIGPR